jgi:GTP-binding protein
MREKWAKMINDYLVLRENLQVVFVLIDARLEPQKNDLEFINSLGERQIPFALIFTKSDKLSATKVSQNVEAFKQAMLEMWEELPPVFVSSAENGKGKEEILEYIESTNSGHQ